jgi:type IX secretion system PorP/SprF family membrane protein
MRVLYLLTVLLILLTGGGAGAQDAVFSQFYASPLQLNPAFAGVSIAPRVTINYRSQHTEYPSAYRTLAVSYEQPVNKSPSSFGFRVLTDSQLEGLYQNTTAALIYAYDIQLSRDAHVRIGLSGGLINSRLDFNSLTFGDIIDPIDGADGITEERLMAVSNSSVDLSSGVLFYARSLYGGFSIEHINRPDENLLRLDNNLYAGRPQRWSLHGGTRFDLKEYSTPKRPVYLIPNFLFTSQAKFRQANLGAYLGYGNVALGAWYRHAFENADGFIGAVTFRKDVVRIGVSYDAVISDLRGVPGGLGPTFELSFAIDFGDSKVIQKRLHAKRYNDCLGMFR